MEIDPIPELSFLIEAESFQNKGGWVVDPQFVDNMGSPYLMAHGMGSPVSNAKTEIKIPRIGFYHLWVRTMNWCPGNWEPPGLFKIIINGTLVEPVFGTNSGWGWQYGGSIEVKKQQTTIELEDLTGFNGRCDALFFTPDSQYIPPNDLSQLEKWREILLMEKSIDIPEENYDLVIVGGGIAGCAAALSASQNGLEVAIIHDRPILGGNASSEIRVHCEGIYGKGAKILSGISTLHWPNGSQKARKDDIKRLRNMQSNDHIHLFLNYRGRIVNTHQKRIVSIEVHHIETGERKRFKSPIFLDSTGDGWLGYAAGAKFHYGRESFNDFDEEWEKHGELWSPKNPDNLTMGSSLLWNSYKSNEEVFFPQVPWALEIAKDYQSNHGGWEWEYASEDKHQISDAEEIRDHLLRAIYGSFANFKRKRRNRKVSLKWVGYILGKRESRRLIGDYIYSMKDIISGQRFPDTVTEETRGIDVHYQQNLNGKKVDFLANAIFRKPGKYFIPYRSLYSKYIANLFVAGRCFSCTHIGLGGTRVMNTTGQMGIAVGKAAYLCKKYDSNPRDIYEHHLNELLDILGYG